MTLSLIAALAENRVIGRDGQLPWRLPGDLKRFKRLTLGHPVVMGRKTFDSIGRLLPGRENVILTRQTSFQMPGATILHTPEALLERFREAGEVFVIGGEEIYRLFLPRAQKLYLTLVHQTVDGDAFFPPFEADAFEELERERIDEPLPHSYVTLRRKA